MAFVATYASSQELSRQFGILGARLAEEARTPDAVRKAMPSKAPQGSKESKIHAAALCYIGTGDVEKAVDVWTRREVEEEYSLMKHSHASSRLGTHVTALQSLMEKVTILRKAINYVDPWVTTAEVPEDGYPLDVLYSH